MLVGCTTTYAISYEFESCSWQGVLNTTLCDNFCQVTFSRSMIFSTNKTGRHDIIEILLKVVLNTIALTLTP
jgi:hypothetical protein